MSMIAPTNPVWSIAGAVLGGVGGFLAGSNVEGGELLWPITLAGVVAGLILGALARTLLGK
jgi:outer membrane lipoprotein SlyB